MKGDFEFVINEFNQKYEDTQAQTETENDECARHVHQCQRFGPSIRFLILHKASIHIRL